MNNIISKLQDFSEKNHQTINKLIAKTILANADINNFANLNLTVLAKQSYTSTASIIRFCKKLGFSGYSEFKFAFLMALEQKNQSSYVPICFSCTNFWKQMEQVFLLFNDEQQLLIKECIIKKMPIYLLVAESSKNNLSEFIKKLKIMFVNIDFRLLATPEANYLQSSSMKKLVFNLTTRLPSWFQSQNYEFIQLVNKINYDLKIDQEQLLFLLAIFVTNFSK